MNTRRFAFALAAAGIVALVSVVAYVAGSSGVRITVENRGEDSLREVTIYVTGKSYPAGDLSPGSSVTQVVSPTSESHVEIEFLAHDGRRVRLNAGGYFESGYQGAYLVRIKEERVESVTNTVRIGPY